MLSGTIPGDLPTIPDSPTSGTDVKLRERRRKKETQKIPRIIILMSGPPPPPFVGAT